MAMRSDDEKDCNYDTAPADDEDYSDEYADDEDYSDDDQFDVEDDDAVGDYAVVDDLEFNVLSRDDIRGRVKEALSEVSSQLSVPKYAALALLYKYRWINSNIYDEWFSDETKTRKNCGLLTDFNAQETKNAPEFFFCGICLEDYEECVKDHRGVMSSCGHVFCETCWRTYVNTAINDGSKCLSLRCPQPSCGFLLGDISKALSTGKDVKRYENHVLRSYLESRKNIKWCPYPGCEFMVELLAGGIINQNFEVKCKCSNGFCWNCSEENHSPAKCDLVAKWDAKNNAESGNKDWVLCNTKPCPKCRKPIEKNAGCMHMTCTPPCGFEFCWLCLSPWSKHGKYTGGFYSCNRYEEARKEGKLSEGEKIRQNAKKALNKYTHYFERWMENHKSRIKAKESKGKLAEQFAKLKMVGDLIVTDVDLEWFPPAWDQIAECRRVLKWSYAYGYYIPDEEPVKKRFFEGLQGDAEANLEKLHHSAENELRKFVHGETVSRAEFDRFKNEIKAQTDSTKIFFVNLVKALTDDLSEVTKYNIT